MAFPTPGMDNNTWGAELNALLEVTLNEDGTPNATAIAAILGALVAGTNITIDTTDPAAPIINASGGATPGYQQLTLTYNGSDPFVVDCLVGAEWDPTIGGEVMGLFPYQMLFGGGPAGDQAVVAYVDTSGVVETFLLFNAGEGGQISCYSPSGEQVGIGIGLPALEGGSGYVASVVAGSGVTVDDTDPLNPVVSSSGATSLSLSYNGNGLAPCEVLNGLDWSSGSGGLLFIIMPAALCGLGEDVPAFAYVNNSGVIGWFSYINNGTLLSFGPIGALAETQLQSDLGAIVVQDGGGVTIQPPVRTGSSVQTDLSQHLLGRGRSGPSSTSRISMGRERWRLRIRRWWWWPAANLRCSLRRNMAAVRSTHSGRSDRAILHLRLHTDIRPSHPVGRDPFNAWIEVDTGWMILSSCRPVPEPSGSGLFSTLVLRIQLTNADVVDSNGGLLNNLVTECLTRSSYCTDLAPEEASLRLRASFPPRSLT